MYREGNIHSAYQLYATVPQCITVAQFTSQPTQSNDCSLNLSSCIRNLIGSSDDETNLKLKGNSNTDLLSPPNLRSTFTAANICLIWVRRSSLDAFGCTFHASLQNRATFVTTTAHSVHVPASSASWSLRNALNTGHSYDLSIFNLKHHIDH